MSQWHCLSTSCSCEFSSFRREKKLFVKIKFEKLHKSLYLTFVLSLWASIYLQIFFLNEKKSWHFLKALKLCCFRFLLAFHTGLSRILACKKLAFYPSDRLFLCLLILYRLFFCRRCQENASYLLFQKNHESKKKKRKKKFAFWRLVHNASPMRPALVTSIHVWNQERIFFRDIIFSNIMNLFIWLEGWTPRKCSFKSLLFIF